MGDIRIRDMIRSDWDSVKRIYKEGMDTNLTTFHNDVPDFETWDATHLKLYRLVIESDGQVAGWIALSPVSKGRAYSGVAEISIYIAKGHWRKNLGFALLSELCRRADMGDIWTLQSDIMENNTGSIRLHEKCGFRMIGYRERIGQDRFGVWRNTVLMERRKA